MLFLLIGMVAYALWYFSVPMPWPAPQPGQLPFEPSRGTLVQTGLLLLPESISVWFGGGEMPLGLFDRVGGRTVVHQTVAFPVGSRVAVV